VGCYWGDFEGAPHKVLVGLLNGDFLRTISKYSTFWLCNKYPLSPSEPHCLLISYSSYLIKDSGHNCVLLSIECMWWALTRVVDNMSGDSLWSNISWNGDLFSSWWYLYIITFNTHSTQRGKTWLAKITQLLIFFWTVVCTTLLSNIHTFFTTVLHKHTDYDIL